MPTTENAEPLTPAEHAEWKALVERMPNLTDAEDARCEELTNRVEATTPWLSDIVNALADLPPMEEDDE